MSWYWYLGEVSAIMWTYKFKIKLLDRLVNDGFQVEKSLCQTCQYKLNCLLVKWAHGSMRLWLNTHTHTIKWFNCNSHPNEQMIQFAFVTDHSRIHICSRLASQRLYIVQLLLLLLLLLRGFFSLHSMFVICLWVIRAMHLFFSFSPPPQIVRHNGKVGVLTFTANDR